MAAPDLAMIKVAVPNMTQAVVDRAIQVRSCVSFMSVIRMFLTHVLANSTPKIIYV